MMRFTFLTLMMIFIVLYSHKNLKVKPVCNLKEYIKLIGSFRCKLKRTRRDSHKLTICEH